MIVASLLLILVAVALLVLGLTGGSSALLIASIAASLLAAIALVIGARRAASRRATAAGGQHESFSSSERAGADAFMAEPDFAAAQRLSHPGLSHAEHANAEHADAEHTHAGGSDQRETVQFDSADVVGRGDLSADEAPVPAWDDAPYTSRSPDYGQAADAIHAARSANPRENAWRRPGADDATAPAGDMAAEAAEAGEFAEPDADDPEDEPLPQAVRPADAVRVSRIDAEVLVVDGRPRYHLADCPHLVGKLTEPIPANEAVELGFSPCGLCRPVDRLVAAAANH